MAEQDQNNYCRCCREDREAAGKNPRRMVTLPLSRATGLTPGKGSTEKKHLPVLACEYCDGPVVANAPSA